jgi:parallel beta-helix repeat protein
MQTTSPLRKGLPVIIVILFVGTSVTTVGELLKVQLTRGNTLYVGGSGSGNYTNIQSAVDAATDGDTIFVYDDSSPYYEHVVVDKAVNLIGENKDTTIIDGSRIGTVILLAEKAIGVTVSGFTVQNSGSVEIEGGIRVYAGYNIITDNIIGNNNLGIDLSTNGYSICEGNIISYNTIINNNRSVWLYCSYADKIFGNYIANNEEGILLAGPQVLAKEKTLLSENGQDNDIYNNTIIDNNDLGIAIENYYYVNIFQNNISNNTYGIYLYAGWFGFCAYFNIYKNTINRNTHGIFMLIDGVGEGAGGIGNNNIFENNITFNGEGIGMNIDVSWGKIRHIRNNTIYQNNFIGNTKHARDLGWNTWYNAITKRGNYWDDYTGKDFLPPYGVGDRRYIIGPRLFLNRDKYPLMKPYNGSQSSLNSPESVI